MGYDFCGGLTHVFFHHGDDSASHFSYLRSVDRKIMADPKLRTLRTSTSSLLGLAKRLEGPPCFMARMFIIPNG